MNMLRTTLPADVPTVFISSVTGAGLTELKDLLWTELNSESNKLQAITEGGSLVHRDHDSGKLAGDFANWDDADGENSDDDTLEEFDFEFLDEERP